MKLLNRFLTGALLFAACSLSAIVNAEEFTIENWKSRVEAGGNMDHYGRLYLEFLLEENPVSGGQYGIHGIEGDPSWYDRRLPDASHAAAVEVMVARKFFLEKLAAIDAKKLGRPDQIDLHILKNQVALDLLQVTHLGTLTNPLSYVDDSAVENTLKALDLIQTRASLLQAESLLQGDRYVLMRDAYLQRREFLINDGEQEDDFGGDLDEYDF